MSKTTENRIARVKKWLKALRSGKFKQGRGMLENNGYFCCLGVACKVNKLEYCGYDGILTDENKNALGLRDPSGDFLDGDALVTMNDLRGAGFRKIATYIEKHKDELFIPSVAKGL